MHILRLRINKNIILIYILLIIGCLRWFFSGVAGGMRLQSVFPLVALGLLFVKRRAKVNKEGLIWLLFIVGIFASLVVNFTIRSVLWQFILISLITFFPMFYTGSLKPFSSVVRMMMFLGTFYGVLIITQYLIPSTFNNFLFPLLNETALDFAQKYFDSGYYYGIFYTPSDPAGLLVFTIAAIMLLMVLKRQKKEKIRTVILISLLFMPLLLTGKKGVLIVGVVAFVLVMLTLYANEKQCVKAIGLMAGMAALIVIFRYLALTYSDNPLFYRFNQFFDALVAGDSVDSGRSTLYYYAMQYWSQHKLFGIGWRNFSTLTVSELGYVRTHEVNCDYIQFLCETGVVGVVLILTPIIATFIKTLKVCRYYIRNNMIENETKWTVLFAVFIQFYILMYAIIETPFYDMMFFTIYIISVIIINIAYREMKKNKYDVKMASTETRP